MADKSKLDKKLKRNRTVLAHYKSLIKEAEQEMKAGHISKEKYRKRKLKLEKKKNLVIRKMKKIRLKIQESK